jgi:hypothetical protein
MDPLAKHVQHGLVFFFFESTIYNAGLERSPQAALQIQVTTLQPLIPALPPIDICAS